MRYIKSKIKTPMRARDEVKSEIRSILPGPTLSINGLKSRRPDIMPREKSVRERPTEDEERPRYSVPYIIM